MRLERVSTNGSPHVAKQFEVHDVQIDDIPEVSKRFRDFVKDLRAVRFLNLLTLDEFEKTTRVRYAHGPPDPGD